MYCYYTFICNMSYLTRGPLPFPDRRGGGISARAKGDGTHTDRLYIVVSFVTTGAARIWVSTICCKKTAHKLFTLFSNEAKWWVKDIRSCWETNTWDKKQVYNVWTPHASGRRMGYSQQNVQLSNKHDFELFWIFTKALHHNPIYIRW